MHVLANRFTPQRADDFFSVSYGTTLASLPVLPNFRPLLTFSDLAIAVFVPICQQKYGAHVQRDAN